VSEDSNSIARVYRASGVWLLVLLACGILSTAGGVAGALYVAKATLKTPHARPWLVGLCAAFGVLGIYTLLSTFRSRVVLFRDRIEVRELTRTLTLTLQEVQGWRSLPTFPPVLVLIPSTEW
jgi:hypothetical protein